MLSSMHAVWSLGAVLGGLVGSAAAGLRVPVPLHVAVVVEDAPASWSAVYLIEHTGAPAGAAGLAFTAFMAAMVAGRLVGDRLVARFGLVRVVRLGGLTAGLALAAALAVAVLSGAVRPALR